MLCSDIRTTITQADFARLVGLSESRVSRLVTEGVLPGEGTADQWLLAYCERLRDQASGRDKELTTERTALTRSQRVGQELRNKAAQGEYAPMGLLADVLAVVSAAIVDEFDALPGQLDNACPGLPAEARAAIEKVIASARRAWIGQTERLELRPVDDPSGEDEEPA